MKIMRVQICKIRKYKRQNNKIIKIIEILEGEKQKQMGKIKLFKR